MLVPALLTGLNDAVTPLGRLDAARMTVPPNPLCGVIVTVVVALFPCATLMLPGDAERLKFGTTTVRVIVALWLKLPEVPVTFIVDVPATTVAPAVSVKMLVPALLTGLNDAVTPLGRLDAARVTVPLKPLCGVIITVVVALFPCTTLTLPGDAERLKFGTTTVRVIVRLWLKLPEVPVTFMVDVPATTEAPAVRVKVLVPVLLTRLNDAVTPLGKPDAVRLTLPLKPPCGVIVRVLVPLLPCVTPRVLGDAERLKFGTVIVRPMVVEVLVLPEVPVTVTVTVPAVAELLAANVRVLVPVVPAGLNEAVTPFGRPDAARLTLLVKPYCGLIVIVLPPLFPCARLRLAGDAERLNVGVPSERTIGALLVKVPEVPVTMTTVVPGDADLLAANVTVLEPAVLGELNEAVTPLGRPDTDRLTVPLKPFCGLTVTLLLTLVPGEKECISGDAESVNPGAVDIEVRSSMRDWPAGVPQPVARS
jgi:hypothetical protein